MDEELLESNEIQGNILSGFNKDFQSYLFLRINRDQSKIEVARAWLRAITPQVSSTAEVRQFNDLFRDLRFRAGRDPHGFAATWLNIAFSADALKLFTSEEEVEQFADIYFKTGLAANSSDLGDPTDPASSGYPKNWVVGGTGNEADILIIIASDNPILLDERVKQIKATLTQGTDSATGIPISTAFTIIWEQGGQTLPPPLTGHEHFGFKDGISQPGIRGLIHQQPDIYLTPRLIDPDKSPQSELDKPEFSRPGQPLVWPGQFVFGYYAQNNNDPRRPSLKITSCPAWGINGSFVVFRRLKQDVATFRKFVHEKARELSQSPEFAGLTPKRLASLMVGRWPSGAPLERAIEEDNPLLGGDELANNSFQYKDDAAAPFSIKAELGYSGDNFPLSKSDSDGKSCPLSAHIRKVNPRDTITEQGNTHDVLARMILRRGIPFGPPYPGELDQSPDEAPLAEGEITAERGLLFVSYQTSIENQFVFLQKNWVNHVSNPSNGGGQDPIIGQNSDNESQRKRFFLLNDNNENQQTVEILPEWIVATGGGFFFSPSISTLTNVLGRRGDVSKPFEKQPG